MDRVTVFCDETGYRWRRRSETGDLLATCAEPFGDLDAALADARLAHPGLPARLSAALALALASDTPPAPVAFLAPPPRVDDAAPEVSDGEVDAEDAE